MNVYFANVCSNVFCYSALECVVFIKRPLVCLLQSTSGSKMHKDTLERTLVCLVSLVK